MYQTISALQFQTKQVATLTECLDQYILKEPEMTVAVQNESLNQE